MGRMSGGIKKTQGQNCVVMAIDFLTHTKTTRETCVVSPSVAQHGHKLKSCSVRLSSHVLVSWSCLSLEAMIFISFSPALVSVCLSNVLSHSCLSVFLSLSFVVNPQTFQTLRLSKPSLRDAFEAGHHWAAQRYDESNGTGRGKA